MITRRNVLAALAGSPVLASIQAIPEVEAELLPNDLVVIETAGLLSIETIKAPILVLSDGLKFSVDRVVIKVEIPETDGGDCTDFGRETGERLPLTRNFSRK